MRSAGFAPIDANFSETSKHVVSISLTISEVFLKPLRGNAARPIPCEFCNLNSGRFGAFFSTVRRALGRRRLFFEKFGNFAPASTQILFQ